VRFRDAACKTIPVPSQIAQVLITTLRGWELRSYLFKFAMSILTEVYAHRWLFICAIALLYGVSKYRTYRRLAAFQGPFSSGWCELWHSYQIFGTRSHLAYRDVNDKYGEWSYVDRKDVC
jgi:hypothetical protein